MQRSTVLTFAFVATLGLPSLSGAAQVTLAWDPNSETDLAGYKIYYGPTAGPPFTGVEAVEGISPVNILLTDLPNTQAPTFTLSGIPSCSHFYSAATAFNATGTESGFSNMVDATIVPKPTAVQVTPGSQEGTLVVSWTGLPSGDTGSLAGFRVYYDTDAGEPYEGTGAAQGPSPVAVAAGTTSLQLSDLAAGTTLYIKVEALCADNTAKSSDEVSGTVTAVVCGNGVTESGETCDPASTCPMSCDDSNACTEDSLSGSADQCNVVCIHSPINACTSGDGCCPSGCNHENDTDCSASCGNGTLESGETCDPPGSCPSSCDDGNTCTKDVLTGNADQCSAVCSNAVITGCAAGDGCCPPGCNHENDTDCSASCGNGIVEPGETCDPPSSCPSSCDDGNTCTKDVLTGSPTQCSAVCINTPITACISRDGCCPSGCNSSNDMDCSGSNPDDNKPKDPVKPTPTAGPSAMEGGCSSVPASGGAMDGVLILIGLLWGIQRGKRK